MKLMEILVNLPIEKLQRIAYNLNLDVFLNSRAGLMRHLLIFLKDEKSLENLINEIPLNEKLILNFILLNIEKNFSDTNPNVLIKKKLFQKNLQLFYDLPSLIKKGIVFQKNRNFIVPDDSVSIIEKTLNLQRSKINYTELSTNSRFDDEKFLFYNDVMQFLIFMHYNKKLSLTQKGELFKKHINKIENLFFPYNEENTLIKLFPMDMQRNYRFNFMMLCCTKLKLISTGKKQISLVSDSQKWIKNSLEEIVFSVYNFIVKQFALQGDFFYGLLLLYFIDENQWISFHEFENLFHLTSNYYSYKDIINEEYFVNSRRNFPLFKNFIFPLFFLGIIQVALDEKKSNILRLSPLGKALFKAAPFPLPELTAPKGIVIPNFEILLSRTAPFYLRWEVAIFSKMIVADTMIKFRFTKKTVISALKNGVKYKRIINVLNEISNSSPLPQNILQSLKDWYETFGRASFSKVVILHCNDEQIAEFVINMPQINKFILKQINEYDFIILSEKVDEIRSILETNELIPVPNFVSYKT